MLLLKKIGVLIICLTLCSASLASSPISLKKITAIGVEDSDDPAMEPYIIFKIAGVEVDRNKNIYILDSKAQNIRVFTPTGKFLRAILRKGGGPGEISDAYHFSLNPQNNKLYVKQTYGYEIKEFSAKGEPLKVFKLKTQSYFHFKFLDENRFITVSINQEKGVKPNFHLVGLPSGKTLRSFGKVTGNFMLRREQTFVLDKNTLWTVSPDSLKLKSIDLKTYEETEICPLPERYKRNAVHAIPIKDGRKLQSLDYSLPLTTVFNERIFVVVTKQDYAIKNKHELAELLSSRNSLFELRGKKLVKLCDIPECDYMSPMAANEDMIYFVRNDPYPQVFVMKLII